MFVPEEWGHLAPNRFVVYGFEYNCLAQWILVQTAASKFLPFEHYFSMSPETLPEITDVTEEILDEGLEAMLGKDASPTPVPLLYDSRHRLLGVGISRLRAEFGDTPTGKNMYGKAIHRVLSRRAVEE